MNTLIDGSPTNDVPADDRGLLFGETVFETMAFCDGRAPLWDLHMARLTRGAQAIGLEMPDSDLLWGDCGRLLRKEKARRAVIRITLTGGSGGQGYWPPTAPGTRRIVQRRAWPATIDLQRRDGLAVVISRFRLGPAAPLSGLKHGNRLLQTMMARECRERAAEEAVLLDDQHQLCEAVSSNLVLVTDAGLMTPARAEVAGVGLSWLREYSGAGLAVGSVGVEQLETLSELLVINSVAGIRPVISVEDKPFPIGPVCRHLQSIWQKELFPCA